MYNVLIVYCSRPQNRPWCEGDEFMGEACNTDVSATLDIHYYQPLHVLF